MIHFPPYPELSKLKIAETAVYVSPVYVAVLVIVLPLAVISLIVYCAVLENAPAAVTLKVAEPPLTIAIEANAVPPVPVDSGSVAVVLLMSAEVESIYAEVIVTVAEPVF